MGNHTIYRSAAVVVRKATGRPVALATGSSKAQERVEAWLNSRARPDDYVIVEIADLLLPAVPSEPTQIVAHAQTLTHFECQRCGHEWTSGATTAPVRCPACGGT